MSGILFVITAPSGAGKSSLIDALLKEDPHLRLSVSYTTRAPRPGEVNGREYHFVDEKTFLAMLERGEFLESAQVHGNHYGTSQAVIREALARGQDLMLEISFRFLPVLDRITLRHRTESQAFDLRKDEPHPMRSLPAVPQLSQGPLVNTLLCFHEAD